jgi:hypothetical protein
MATGSADEGRLAEGLAEIERGSGPLLDLRVAAHRPPPQGGVSVCLMGGYSGLGSLACGGWCEGHAVFWLRCHQRVEGGASRCRRKSGCLSNEKAGGSATPGQPVSSTLRSPGHGVGRRPFGRIHVGTLEERASGVKREIQGGMGPVDLTDRESESVDPGENRSPGFRGTRQSNRSGIRTRNSGGKTESRFPGDPVSGGPGFRENGSPFC